MRTINTLLAIVIMISLLASCKKTADSTLVLILFDNSESTAPRNLRTSTVEDRRPDYLRAAREIVSSAGPGVTIQAGRITGQSLRITNLPVNVTLPAFNPAFDNPNIFKDRLLKAKRDAITQIGHAINDEERTSQTCILDSLILAEQIFQGSTHSRKVLVIMSDMNEDCGALDFDANPRPGTRGLPRNQDQSTRLLAELRQNQKIPNLKVEVFVYGATGGQKEDDTSERFILIRNWWKSYFQAAGADVKDYGVFLAPPAFADSAVNVRLKADDPGALSTSTPSKPD